MSVSLAVRSSARRCDDTGRFALGFPGESGGSSETGSIASARRASIEVKHRPRASGRSGDLPRPSHDEGITMTGGFVMISSVRMRAIALGMAVLVTAAPATVAQDRPGKVEAVAVDQPDALP